ncbi:ATP-binding SpoIIE family protein phosphatase, partial [Kineococcus glutinatus]|uniref:ATP-binding SpoIIE family protein phosphatase n=1 Tax=Kineococcus glutinatus TaxID=1070872 RepID=UPI0031EF7B61
LRTGAVQRVELDAGPGGPWQLAVAVAGGLLAVRFGPSDAPARARLAEAMAATLDGFCVLTALPDATGSPHDFRVDYVNAAGVLPGVDPATATGRPLSAVLRHLGPEQALHHARAALRAQAPQRALLQIDAGAVGGAPDMTFDVLFTPAGPGQVDVSYRDVSEEARQRRLLQRSTRRAHAAARRAEVLLETASALSQAVTLEQVQDVVMERSPAVLGCDGTMVCLLEDQRLVVSHVSGYPREFVDALADPAKLAACPVADAATTGRVHFVESPEELLRRFPAAGFVLGTQRRRAWASLPLVVSGRVIGGWSVAYAGERVFDDDERRLLRTLAGHYAQALERARLHGIAHDTAVQLQRALLPADDLLSPGLPLATHYVPAAQGFEVGGDFYSVIPLPSGSTAVVIGDVAGHNLAAAAVMGQVRNAMHAYALEGHSPSGVVERVNRLMRTRGIQQFATCAYLEVQPDTGAVTVVLAGHPPPLVRSPGGQAQALDVPPDLPLGVEDELRPTEHTLLLAPGSLVLLFTDGLVETRSGDLDTGLRRLRAALEALPPVPQRVVDGVVPAMVREGSQEDDIAVLALRIPARRGRGTRVARQFPSDPASVAAARRFVTDVLQAWAAERVADEAEVLTSELVTNAVLHTTEGVDLVVLRLADAVRVEIADSSVRMPVLREVDEEAVSGRGLHIVDLLARSWGVEPTEHGKRVFFELAV